jgi:hypothetical protein
MSEKDFHELIIPNCLAVNAMDPRESGLLMDGLKQFFVNEIDDKHGNEDFMFEWLENLGYDSNLHPVRSRNYVLSLHSVHPIDLKVQDAL